MTAPTQPSGRRWGPALGAAGLAGLIGVGSLAGLTIGSTGALPAARAASPQGLTAKLTDAAVGADRTVQLRVSCGRPRACTGTVRLTGTKAKATNARVTTPRRQVKLAAGTSRTVRFTLTAGQAAKVAKAGKARVTVVLRGPWGQRRTVATLRPATTQLSVRSTRVQVKADRKVQVIVRCTASTACRGTLRAVVGTRGAAVSYAVASGTRTTVRLTLSAAQYAQVATAGTVAGLQVRSTAPERVNATAYLTLVRAGSTPATPTATPTPTPTPTPTDPGVAEPVYSVAYTERNWTPTSYDTCPAALHAAYNVTGPDGKVYPTWHPARTTDPATGETCTFGHEHGADPESSDIYDWVAEHFAAEGAEDSSGIPFGYASEKLAEYGEHHSGMTMRHEDNGGHKVQVANNVKLLDEDRNWVKDASGATVVCDYLIKAHQGSWSPDATSNNAHELIYAARCTDGTEIISATLSKYGNSNEFNKSCGTNPVVSTVSSTLPGGYGGRRIIPDNTCVAQHASGSTAALWGIYELWESENKLTTADGTVLASFDPWFGVRNPSRYYDAASSTATSNGVLRTVDKAWGANAATGYPWSTINATEKFDYRDPRSPFDGAQRDFYLNQTSVSAEAPEQVWTDPYGTDAATEPFPGSIPQHLVPGSATTGVSLATQKFDSSKDYGLDNGVHAPN